MIRRIECLKCFKVPLLSQRDVAQGWAYRTTTAKVKKPKVHETKITTTGDDGKSSTETIVHASILCDQCGGPIKDGSQAKLVTMWNRNREGEPGRWEEEFTL